MTRYGSMRTMSKGGRTRTGPSPWINQMQMRFDDRLINVRVPATTRDPVELKGFLSDHSHMSDASSFSRIVSFDTECSINDRDYCEICSFGYAEYDLDGNELAREEIYIRARKPWGRLKVKCQADYSKFKDAPSWKEQYRRIREVLTRKDTIYIAHSSGSDIGFIMTMNRHHDTEQFYIRTYDTMRIFKRALPEIKKYSLAHIADHLGIEHDAHVSLSDAIVCFDILSKVVEMKGVTLREMMVECEDDAVVDSIDVLREKIRTDRRRQIEVFKGSTYNPIRGPLTGHRFTTDDAIEKSDPEAVLALATHIASQGAMYVSNISDADIYLWNGDVRSRAYLFAMRLVNTGHDLEIVTFAEAFDGRYGEFPEVCWNLVGDD